MNANITISSLTDETLKEIIQNSIQQALNRPIEHKVENTIKHITRYEAIEMLRISLPTLASWTKKGKLIKYRVEGRVLYRQDEIIAFIKSGASHH